MKPEDNIKKLYEKAAVNTNPEMDEAVLGKILTAQAKPNIWRLIMKNPVIKFAAAAIVIAGAFILFIYSTDGQDSQQNSQFNIVKIDDNNKTELPGSTDRLAKDLLQANRFFKNNDISGLSQLLNNEFEAVQFQVAEYLGQIGDESVLAELQVLADKWQGPVEENVFLNAISVINERLTETKQEPQETITETNNIQNRTLNNTEVDELRKLLRSSTSPDDQDDEDEEEPREPILFGTVIDIQGNPVAGAMVYSSYANFGITNNKGEFELLVPPTDGSGSIGTADFPMFVWSFTDDPSKIAWTLIRDPEAAEDNDLTEEYPKTEETHQGVELIIEDENDLFINTHGVPGDFLDIDGDINVENIVLVMEPAGVISGQIKGIQGQPLAGAVVRVEELHMQLSLNELIVRNFDKDWKPGPECVTDYQGYYTLTNIPNCWTEAHLTIIESQGHIETYQIITNKGENTIWNIQLSETDINFEREILPEQKADSIIPESSLSEDVHFPDAIIEGYPLRGGKNSISEVIPSNLKNNLVLYYSFYNSNDPKTVTDISGNKNNALVVMANYGWEEIMGGMMFFNGEDGYLILPEMYLDTFTFSAWVNARIPNLNNRRIFLLDDGENYYAIQGNTSEGIGAYITENLEINEYDYELVADKWVYITVTFDSHTVCIYMNGQLTESGTRIFSGGIIGKAYIGFSGNTGDDERHDGDYCWQGYIDEVALFNRALTAEEVEQLFFMTGTYVK